MVANVLRFRATRVGPGRGSEPQTRVHQQRSYFDTCFEDARVAAHPRPMSTITIYGL